MFLNFLVCVHPTEFFFFYYKKLKTHMLWRNRLKQFANTWMVQSFTIHNIYLNIQIISIQIIQYIILHLLSMIPSISYGNLQLIHSPIETAILKYTRHVYQLVETYNDLRKNYELHEIIMMKAEIIQ